MHNDEQPQSVTWVVVHSAPPLQHATRSPCTWTPESQQRRPAPQTGHYTVSQTSVLNITRQQYLQYLPLRICITEFCRILTSMLAANVKWLDIIITLKNFNVQFSFNEPSSLESLQGELVSKKENLLGNCSKQLIGQTPLPSSKQQCESKGLRKNTEDNLINYYDYIRLMAFFSKTTWVSWHQKGKPFWILLEQKMMGWHWHQLDHMQPCQYLTT